MATQKVLASPPTSKTQSDNAAKAATLPVFQQHQKTLRALVFLSAVGVYAGVWNSFTRKDGSIHPAMGLWTSRKTGSTYSLPMDGLTVAAIKKHTATQDSKFEPRPPASPVSYFVVETNRGQLVRSYDSENGLVLTDQLALAKLFPTENSAHEVVSLFAGRVRRVLLYPDGKIKTALLHGEI